MATSLTKAREARIRRQRGKAVRYSVTFYENRSVIELDWESEMYVFDNLGEIRAWFKDQGYSLHCRSVKLSYKKLEPNTSANKTCPSFMVYPIDIGPYIPAEVVPGGVV